MEVRRRFCPAPKRWASRCFVSCLCAAAAALPSTAFDRIQARLIDGHDGLTNLAVTSFAQQSDGHLWVGTENGLFRYNGSTFTAFGRADGLDDPTVYSLLIDHTGTLWAGAHGGLFRLEGRTFRAVPLHGDSMRVGVNSMLTSTASGELIVETSKGIVSVERNASGVWEALLYSERHPAFPTSDDTDGVTVDSAGRLWFGCAGKICSFAGGQLRVLGPDQGVPQDVYVSLYQTREGRMWARGRKHVLTWNPGGDSTQDLTPSFPAGAIATNHRRFIEDAGGKVLTPTANGFATWDGAQWTETLTTTAGDLGGASDLFAGREGGIWIGTPGLGLFQALGYGQWRHYGTAEGMENPDVRAIAEDRVGRIWIGEKNGSNLLIPETGEILPTPLAKEKDSTFVEAFAPDPAGGMWVATILGRVFHVDAHDKVDFRVEIDAYINHILLDPQGALWASTSSGVFVLRCPPAGRCDAKPAVAPLAKTDILDIALAPDGGVWVASKRGLDRIRMGPAQAIEVRHIEMAGESTRFELLSARSDGSLWISAPTEGVLLVRFQGDAAQVVRRYSFRQLASNLVQFLDSDSEGRLWIGTDHGVNVLSDGKILRLTDEDGLISNQTNSFLARQGGAVWIGTAKGVSELLDPASMLHRQRFAAVIEDARYGAMALDAGSRLRWSGATPELSFSGLTFRNNRSLIYHYRLAGFDVDETSTSETSARFARLPPGSYTFMVRAEDPLQGVTSSTAKFSFILTPPWWRTPAFDVLLGAALLGLIYAVWRWRNLALIAQRRTLQKMVRERTVELERMAVADALTGLLNRGALFAALDAEYLEVRRKKSEICVAIVDLDHFKQINDTLGHQAGDEVLRQAARRLLDAARITDIVGRYGGEEFMIVFRDMQRGFGMERCEAIRRALCEMPIRWEDRELTVTCSIGMAWTRGARKPVGELLAEADRALYEAKANGRNQVRCAAEDLASLAEK